MNINEKIYSLRKEHNLSQEELANRLNVSRQTISKWELGESNPDSDKIVPLCEVFGISTEELLRDRKIEENGTEVEPKQEENKVDLVKAGLICLSIFLYFLAVAFIVIGETAFELNDGIVVSGFLLICGLATALIVFTCMTRRSKRSNEEKKMDPLLKSIISIVASITTAIYLIISFVTMAWHLTWLIWVIYSVIVEIIKLAFSLKGEKQDNE